MATKNIFEFGENVYNILFSEEGLVPKTHQGDVSMAKTVDGELIMKQGDLYTDPVSGEIGVVADTYAFAVGESKPVAVIVAGHLVSERLSAEAVAKATDFAAQGLFLH